MGERSAIGVCESCGMPVRVVFNPDGTIKAHYAVCKCPRAPSSTQPEHDQETDPT